MAATLTNVRLTPQQYLEQERRAEFKSEYLNGETFAMADTTLNHARIVTNLVFELTNKLTGSGCEVVSTDLRLEVTDAGLFTYPDVMVFCGEALLREDGALDTLKNPKVIVEVLSPSTQNYDKGDKFDYYKNLPSLSEYLTIAQSEMFITNRVRQPGQQWLVTDYFGKADQMLVIEGIRVSIRVSNLYRNVKLA